MTIDVEITEWLSFAKGDVPGHEFHGNQYQEAQGLSKSTVEQAKGLAANTNELTDSDLASVHDAAAMMHHGVLSSLLDHPTAPGSPKYGAYKDAVVKTVDAIHAHQDASESAWGDKSGTAKAEQATNDADKAVQALGPSDDEATVTKGDTPGHPFRGNQWGAGPSVMALAKNLAGAHIERGAATVTEGRAKYLDAISKQHDALANTHTERHNALVDAANSKDPHDRDMYRKVTSRHTEAAVAHFNAGTAARDAASAIRASLANKTDKYNSSPDLFQHALNAQVDAAQKSATAYGASGEAELADRLAAQDGQPTPPGLLGSVSKNAPWTQGIGKPVSN